MVSVEGMEKPTLSLGVSDLLSKVAHHTGVPEHSLVHIEVPLGSEDLYHAALEYAALHPPVSVDFCSDFATDKDDANCRNAVQRPLWQSPDDQFYENNDTSSDSDDFDSDYDCDSDHGDDGDEFIRPGRGLKQRRTRVPKFQFGLGSTAVHWPPPPQLQAKVLAKSQIKAKKRLNSSSQKVNGALPCKSKTECLPSVNTDQSSYQAKSEARVSSSRTGIGCNDKNKSDDSSVVCNGGMAMNSDDVRDGNINDSVGGWSSEQTIYYFHFIRGRPVSQMFKSPTIHRTLLLIGVDGKEKLTQFAQEVIKWRDDKDYRPSPNGRYRLYRFKTNAGCERGWWASQGLKHARPVSSIVLPEGQLNAILDDVRSFLASDTKAWYLKHGLPHRRSYLFYGPPGTGKTSTISAVASHFRLNCCYLTMTDRSFNNQVLADAVAKIPENAIIVLEDIDALFNEDRKNEDGCALTFSGMLNALDGFLSSSGVLTIMTTNHLSRLDSALIRGGRVDRRFEFPLPTQLQAADLFLSFYPDAPRELADRFATIVFDQGLGNEARSIATLQQLFIYMRRESAEACVASIPEFYATHFPNGTLGNSSVMYS